MKKEYIIERQGKQFVLYEGLLDEAHQQGLCRISTTLIQVPHPDNGNVAIVAAEVETSKGSFSGYRRCVSRKCRANDRSSYRAHGGDSRQGTGACETR